MALILHLITKIFVMMNKLVQLKALAIILYFLSPVRAQEEVLEVLPRILWSGFELVDWMW